MTVRGIYKYLVYSFKPINPREEEDKEVEVINEIMLWRQMMLMKIIDLMLIMLINRQFVCTAVCK